MITPPFGPMSSSFDNYSSKEELEQARKRSIRRSWSKVQNLIQRLNDTIESSKAPPAEKEAMRKTVLDNLKR